MGRPPAPAPAPVMAAARTVGWDEDAAAGGFADKEGGGDVSGVPPRAGDAILGASFKRDKGIAGLSVWSGL